MAGVITRKNYRHGGEFHRDDGPAQTKYNEDGSIWQDVYCQHGDISRKDGPAVIDYFPDGSVRWASYYSEGDNCREDGPAEIKYNEDGSIDLETYLWENKKVSRAEALRRYLASLGMDGISEDNHAAMEWLTPHIEQDPKTRAFLPPDPNLVSIALSLHENPALGSRDQNI